MIISASRRTDIPAFYADWFLGRLKAGFLYVRNPVNNARISKVLLKDVVDFIVFWTKNPANLLSKLDYFHVFRIPYYFQFTLTSYGKDLEKNLPPKKELIDIFRRLSDSVGKKRVIWRYDPILFTSSIDMSYHERYFELIAKKLENYTSRCVISFLDLYKKCQRNLKGFNIIDASKEKMEQTGKIIGQIANAHNLAVETCAEEIDLSKYGIKKGKCIDDALISKIIGQEIRLPKDKSQRAACGCVESIDIGAYNTCLHNCLYCYANFNHEIVKHNYASHDPKSPLLIGNIQRTDLIVERKAGRSITYQRQLFG